MINYAMMTLWWTGWLAGSDIPLIYVYRNGKRGSFQFIIASLIKWWWKNYGNSLQRYFIKGGGIAQALFTCQLAIEIICQNLWPNQIPSHYYWIIELKLSCILELPNLCHHDTLCTGQSACLKLIIKLLQPFSLIWRITHLDLFLLNAVIIYHQSNIAKKFDNN